MARPPTDMADNGGQASADPHERLERLGKFLGKDRGQRDRLGKFSEESLRGGPGQSRGQAGPSGVVEAVPSR